MKWNDIKFSKKLFSNLLRNLLLAKQKSILCIKWSSLEIKIKQFEVVHACSWWKIAWHNLTFYDFFSWLFFLQYNYKSWLIRNMRSKGIVLIKKLANIWLIKEYENKQTLFIIFLLNLDWKSKGLGPSAKSRAPNSYVTIVRKYHRRGRI